MIGSPVSMQQALYVPAPTAGKMLYIGATVTTARAHVDLSEISGFRPGMYRITVTGAKLGMRFAAKGSDDTATGATSITSTSAATAATYMLDGSIVYASDEVWIDESNCVFRDISDVTTGTFRVVLMGA